MSERVPSVNKQALVDAIAQKAGVSKKTAAVVLTATLDVIVELGCNLRDAGGSSAQRLAELTSALFGDRKRAHHRLEHSALLGGDFLVGPGHEPERLDEAYLIVRHAGMILHELARAQLIGGGT